MTKKAITKAEKDHLALVAGMPCCVCGYSPVQVHHIREGMGMGMRASHFDTLPLCFAHHQGKEGIHTLGTKKWRGIYGSEVYLLKNTKRDIETMRLSKLFSAG